jgi:DNA-directed RNA polymerase specialized sigma24 family protein
MRRILVERARRKRLPTEDCSPEDSASDLVFAVADCRDGEVVAVDQALEELQRHDPEAAELVKLRFFVGLSHQEAAQAMGISRRQADRLWVLARTWLYRKIARQ